MENNKKKVTVIPASIGMEANKEMYDVKTRVCAYARVSTELDEQQNSYAAQINYYTEHIKRNPDWEYVGVYADEGISGTSTKHREQFNRMIRDAKDGKIDLILTKSISRFARNTLDTIRITRELKAIGVEVFFEKENLRSMDSTTEVQLTILSSLAQDESRSISENVKWGQERRMQEGRFALPWKNFLGYDKGPDGMPVINEEEARIVRVIYDLYLAGKTSVYIANYLTEQGVLSPGGKRKWSQGTVLSILKNEKYKGDAKLHKTYVVDYLTKEVRVNNGEVSQYYVTNSHPAIIDRETFDSVQEMIKERSQRSGARNNKYYFNDKLFCEKCGNPLSRNVRKAEGKEYVAWNCIAKYRHKKYNLEPCSESPAYEPELRNGYIRAMNELIARRGELLAKYGEEIAELSSRGARAKLALKIDEISEEYIKREDEYIDLMKNGSRDYTIGELNELREKKMMEIKETKERLEKAKEKAKNMNIRLYRLKLIYGVLGKYSSRMLTFDETAFRDSIDKVMVANTYFKYIFLDGQKIKVDRAERRGSHDPEGIQAI